MADGPLVAKTGNITKPPEVRFSKAGKPFAKFSIAVNPYVPQGQEKPPAQFYEVTCFGSLATNVGASLKKGYRVLVIGRGEINKWTDKQGIEHSDKVIVADSVGPDLRFVCCDLFKLEDEPVPAAQPAPLEYAEDEEPF